MSTLVGRTILLTGATGFIGQHMLNRLRQIDGTRLVLLSRNPCDGMKEGETWVNADLDRLTRQTWSDHRVCGIDIVFHLGSFTPKVSNGGDAVDDVYRSNLMGTRTLLEGLPNVPEKIVFSSTLDVYASPQSDHLLTEESPVDPSSLYGASKLFGEHLIKAYARQNGCRYAILRYGHIYGPGEGAYAKLIPIAIQTLLKGESPEVYGDGSVLRDFLYVEDAVEATLRAARAENEKIGPVNIVRGTSNSIREIVETLAKLTGYSGNIQYLLDKPAGRSLRFSNDRMVEILGRWRMFPLEEGLSHEVAYFKELAKKQQ